MVFGKEFWLGMVGNPSEPEVKDDPGIVGAFDREHLLRKFICSYYMLG